MVTLNYADMFEQFYHVKQLNTTAKTTHSRKAYFTCVLIQTHILLLGHIPVSLIKRAKYVKKILNIKYVFYLRILSIHNHNTSSAIFHLLYVRWQLLHFLFSTYKMEEFVAVCGISKWSAFRIYMQVKTLKCQDTFPLISVRKRIRFINKWEICRTIFQLNDWF